MCSRREADRYIEQGMVRVDGLVVSELGTRVSPSPRSAPAETTWMPSKI